MLNRIVTTGLAVAMATGVSAGGFSDEIIEPIEIIEVTEDRGSLPGWIVPAAIVVGLIAIASSSGTNDGGGEGGGTGGGNAGNASDLRLKTDVTRVGSTADGLPLYQFRYIGLSQVYEGVMAQDVLEHRPEAVTVGPMGVMFVDYGMLGLTMRPVG